MNESKRSLFRFTGSIVSAVIATVDLILKFQSNSHADEIFLPLSVLLGVPLFLAIDLARESRGWTAPRDKWIGLSLGTAFLVFHYLLTRHDSTWMYYLKYLQISLAIHLLVALSTTTHKTSSENSFWQLNRTIFLRILFSFVYASVFFVGVAIALLTLKSLFGLTISEKVYLDLWLFSAITLQTWHFLTGLPLDLRDLENDHSYPRGLRVFVQYLLIPLASLYMIILYTYMAKILFTGVWPQGSVAWLVSIISVLGIFNLLLLDPEKHHAETRWIRTYSKSFYLLILPLIAMLFVAIGKRIGAYGLTEQRYFLTVLGSLLAVLALYFLLSKSKSIRVVPLALLIVSLGTLAGPWSAYSMSRRSQLARAEEVLKRHGLLDSGLLKKAEAPVPEADKRELASIFDYILRFHGSKYLTHWFPVEVLTANRTEFRNQNSFGLMAHLGLEYKEVDYARGPTPRFHLRASEPDAAVQTAGFTHARVYQSDLGPRTLSFNGRNFMISFEHEGDDLYVTEKGAEILRIRLSQMVKAIPLQEIQTGLPMERDRMIVDAQNENLKLRFHVQVLSGEFRDDKIVFDHVSGLILAK